MYWLKKWRYISTNMRVAHPKKISNYTIISHSSKVNFLSAEIQTSYLRLAANLNSLILWYSHLIFKYFIKVFPFEYASLIFQTTKTILLHNICQNNVLRFTYAVIREIQDKWLKASSIWTKLFPNNFTEKENSHISVSL